MELNIFMRELETALVERGISGETAKKHVSNLRRSFTDDDLAEIESLHSVSAVNELADSIALVLSKNTRGAVANAGNPVPPSPQKSRPNTTQTPSTGTPQPPVRRAQASVPAQQAAPRPKPVQAQPVPQPKPQPKPVQRRIDIPEEDDYYDYSPETGEASARGMILFWVGLFLTLPVTLALGAVLFGAFAALFVGLAALIVAIIAVLIAVAACGAGVSLVGIIFGVTQLFSFVAAGIYEIGLGIMVAGAVLFVSVLLYNIAIRLLPWIISLLGTFLGWTCGKLKNLFYVVRRECYKL